MGSNYEPVVDETLAVNDDGYELETSHTINDEILQKSLAALEGAASKMAADCLQDAGVRQKYIDGVKRMSSTILEEVSSGKITAQKGAELANELRNSILEEMRTASTPQGREYAKLQKANGVTLEQILEKNAQKIFGKPFSQLSEADKTRIYYRTIESAGKTRLKTDGLSRRLNIAGKVCIVITVAIGGYRVLTSDNKPKELLRQGGIIAGGLLGGKAGVAAVTPVSGLCGIGAPICIVAGALIGALGGAIAAESVMDYFDEEIEEFLQWGIY